MLGTTRADYAGDIQVLPDGSLYVVGVTSGAFAGFTNAGDHDAFIIKLDPSGVVLWVDQFGTPGYEAAETVATGPMGEVYVLGEIITEALPGQTASGFIDVFVRKYSSTGSLLWTRQFGSSQTERPSDLAVGTAGQLYVAGSTLGALPGQTHVEGSDSFVRAYDTDGLELWTWQVGYPGDDSPAGVTVDAAGALYVAGTIPSGSTVPGEFAVGGADTYLFKLSADGDVLWQRQLGSTGTDNAEAVVTTSDGDIVVLTQQRSPERRILLNRYDTNGFEWWSASQLIPQSLPYLRMAAGTMGSVLVSGWSDTAVEGSVRGGGYVFWFDMLGQRTRVVQFGAGWLEFESVAVDAAGRAYVIADHFGAVPFETGIGGRDVSVLRLAE
jgi:hypothetical protein